MNGKVIIPESVILNLEFEYAKELCEALVIIVEADYEKDFLSYDGHDAISKLKRILEENIKTMEGVVTKTESKRYGEQQI